VKIVTYSRLTTNSFSKFVKVNEELLNSDSISCYRSLYSFLYIALDSQLRWCALVGAGVAVMTLAHMLNCIAELMNN
jgi:hypothetical protein